MRIFGVDPGSQRTGYGCIETDGSRHRVIVCGALTTPGRSAFSEKLVTLHRGLTDLLTTHQPETLAIEDLFYAKNARSASQLGHVRGVLMLAAASGRHPDFGVLADRGQARCRWLRPSGEGAGAADGHPASRLGRGAVPTGCFRRAGRRHLSLPFAWADRTASPPQIRKLASIPT